MLPLHFSFFREFSACKNATVFRPSVGERVTPKLMNLTEKKRRIPEMQKEGVLQITRGATNKDSSFAYGVWDAVRSLLGVKIVAVAAAAAAVTLGHKEKQGSVEAQTWNFPLYLALAKGWICIPGHAGGQG